MTGFMGSFDGLSADTDNPISSTHYPALGFDPAPGSPGAVSAAAAQYSTVAASLSEARDALDEIGHSDGIWQGQAADAFRAKVGQLPDYLAQANTSLSDAAKTLDQWSADLTALQHTAADYESQAEAAQRRLQMAQGNPNLKLAGETFPNAQALRQAQTELDAAQAELTAAQQELDSIRAQAKDLFKRHQGMVIQTALALRKAKDEAPDEPDLMSQLGGLLGDAFIKPQNLLGDGENFLKQHAHLIGDVSDVLSDMSAVFGAVGAVCDVTGVGTLPGLVIGAISSGLSNLAMMGHAAAKFGGDTDVSTQTIVMDGVGGISLGIGNAVAGGLKASGAIEKVAEHVGSAFGDSIGLGSPSVGTAVNTAGDKHAPSLFGDFEKYWKPQNTQQTTEDIAVPPIAVYRAFRTAIDDGNNEDSGQ